MVKDLEKEVEKGRAIKDMIDTEGWRVFELKIKQEIKDEYELLRNFPIEKQGLSEIAAEYLEHRANLNAYERVLGFIQEFLISKEDAQNKLR